MDCFLPLVLCFLVTCHVTLRRDGYHQICIYPTPLLQTKCNIKTIFKQSTAGSNLEFSFSLVGCFTKVKEPSLPYYLTLPEERTDEFMPFSRALAFAPQSYPLSVQQDKRGQGLFLASGTILLNKTPAEYVDCISVRKKDPHPPKECRGYDTKPSDGNA